MGTAVAEWRKARSVELVLQGHTYDQVAAEVGYANRGTAWRTVSKALAEQKEQAVDELRALEVARLDYLQTKLLDGIEAGEVKSINAAVRIILARSRLYGLDKPSEPVQPPVGRVVIDPAELAARGEAAMRRDTEATAAWYAQMFGPSVEVAGSVDSSGRLPDEVSKAALVGAGRSTSTSGPST
jgi:hypothetical protein